MFLFLVICILLAGGPLQPLLWPERGSSTAGESPISPPLVRHARIRSRRSSRGRAWMDFPAFFWASRSS